MALFRSRGLALRPSRPGLAGPELAFWPPVFALAGILATSLACNPDGSSGTSSTDAASSEAGSSAATETTSKPGTGGESTANGETSDESAGGSETSDEPTTAGTTGEPPHELVPVAHTREFRAVWVATVTNINFPSMKGLDAGQLEGELVAIVDTAEAAGLNAIVFQVRPECDALYSSSIEPWSRYLTGTQGEDPGLDPLQVLIEQARPRGIEVHAWLNPYRANASQVFSDNVAQHVASKYPQYAYKYGSTVWMDPGAKEVQDQLVAVVADLVTRYDLDGIHFDDYFYPYPIDGVEFPDDSTWEAYQSGGGQLSRADWRRDNVNAMVETVGLTIADIKPWVRYGISPFGIYRPGIPAGIVGFDQYEGLYADPLLWMQEGWLDYLAPQLYWPTTQQAQAYGTLIEWWSSITEGGRYIFAGNYLSKLGSEDKWSLDEFKQQILLSRQYAGAGSQGNIWFQIAPLQQNALGVTDALKQEFYQTPALTPPIAALAGEVVEPPTLALEDTTAIPSHPAPESLRAWVVYQAVNESFVIDRVLPATASSIALAPGTWAISAAGKHGVESLGAVVTVQ